MPLFFVKTSLKFLCISVLWSVLILRPVGAEAESFSEAVQFESHLLYTAVCILRFIFYFQRRCTLGE